MYRIQKIDFHFAEVVVPKLGSATKDPDRKPPEIGTLIGDALLMSGCPREPQFPKP